MNTPWPKDREVEKVKAGITSAQAQTITHAIAKALSGLVTDDPAKRKVTEDVIPSTGQKEIAQEPEHSNARILAQLFDTSGLPTPAFEKLYQRLKQRLLDELPIDPIFLKILAARPEIEVLIEPKVVQLDGGSLKGRIARLMVSGFFKDAPRQGTVRAALTKTGSEPNSGQLSTTVNEFVRDGFLVREGDGYVLSPGVKVSERTITAT